MGENPKIKAIRYVATMTGAEHTGRWDVYGTDLGIPVYSPKQKRMYFLFGDTLGAGEVDKSKPRNWRGTVAGYTEKLDFSDGVRWDGFLDDGTGKARHLVPAHYTPDAEEVEKTKISQGGLEIGGKLYVFYESINHWGTGGSGRWFLNYGGTLRSVDGGKSFEKVYDLTWLEPTGGAALETATRIAAETMDNQPSGIPFDAAAHIAPGFGQDYAVDGMDGYVYLYGRAGGRIDGIKLGRVKKENFETFSAWEYLTEYRDGAPVWKPYREGLDAIVADPARAEIIPGPTSNMSVQYNLYLGKWLLTYYIQRTGIFYAVSDTPYGPFSTPELFLPREHPELLRFLPEDAERYCVLREGRIPYNFLYGGFTNAVMNREGGRIVPIVVSNWYPTGERTRFYGTRLLEIEFA
jgi:hypothetical protein